MILFQQNICTTNSDLCKYLALDSREVGHAAARQPARVRAQALACHGESDLIDDAPRRGPPLVQRRCAVMAELVDALA